MIKVLFDHQIFSEQKYGGISRYFKYLIDGIKQDEEVDYDLGLLRSNNYYIQGEHQLLKNRLFDRFFTTHAKLVKRSNSYSKYLLNKNNFSVFHPTYFDTYFLKHLKKPLVITVHDMTYEALPHYFSSTDALPFQKRLLMEKADRIIAISETTKKDILMYSNIKEEKVVVIHHGIENSQSEYEIVENLPEKYILFVGARWSYKNFYLLANAFKAIASKYPDLRLVLAGGGPLTFGDSEFLIRNNILEKTIQISATDKQLNTLYKNALCFIYPSLYEGFGLPILEAFKNGCPTLLSDCSCFREVAGDAAIYFDHLSLTALTSEIENLLDNKQLTTQLIAKGQARLNKFPIEKCISKTIDLYKTIV